jgi:hypothetical protein
MGTKDKGVVEVSEAWRGVLEYQVLVNGVWEDRRWVSDVYSKGSSGPMRQVNAKAATMLAGRFYEGSYHTKDLQKFTKDEITVLAKYKEESETWRQI